MNKKLLITILCFTTFGLIAQQQPQNASFEEWEMVGLNNQFEEPVNWSSLKTAEPDVIANAAPFAVISKSSDAHTGNFSVKLKNIFVAIAGIVANGVVTNGRVHGDFNPESGNVFTNPNESQWNTPLTLRPDSLVGYYKYISIDGDAAQVQALLHAGVPGSIPQADSLNWVGLAKANLAFENVTEWTRFSVAFDYFLDDDPDYILFNFSAGNGFDAVAESEMWLDDIELIYNVDAIDEQLAENLMNVFGYENTIVADLRKFEMGTRFELGIYDLTGKLVKSQTLESGNKYKINDFKPGLYICSFQSSDGFVITKKVVVR